MFLALRLKLLIFCAFLSVVFPETSIAQIIPIPPRIEERSPNLDQTFPDVDSIDPLTLPGGADQFLFEGPEQFVLRTIRFSGNKAVDSETINAAISKFEGKIINREELKQIEETIDEIYQREGYESSRAFVTDESEFEGESLDVHIQIIEVELSEIKALNAGRLERYIKRQLSPIKGDILDSDRLLNKIRFLLLDERVEDVDVSVNLTPRLEQRNLIVEVDPAKQWSVTGLLNNARSPSVGSFERGVSAKHLNVVGLGDELSVDYRNTDGSNIVAARYELPVTDRGGTVSLSYLFGNSQIITDPFEEFEIETETQSFNVGFNHPILRQSNEKIIQELELGIGFTRTENDDQILGFSFPVTEGADNDGKIRSTRLDFSQQFTRRSRNSTFLVNSTFGFGLGIGTTNDPEFGNGEFVKWNGQGVFAQNLTKRLLSISSADIQVSDRDLIGNEQFSLGGHGSVRGFLSNQLARTNGLSLSQEFQFQAISKNEHQVDLLAFFDFGTAWNNQTQINETSESLASIGLGLTYQFKGLRAALEYGFPLFGDDPMNNSLQGNGLLLNLQFTF